MNFKSLDSGFGLFTLLGIFFCVLCPLVINPYVFYFGADAQLSGNTYCAISVDSYDMPFKLITIDDNHMASVVVDNKELKIPYTQVNDLTISFVLPDSNHEYLMSLVETPSLKEDADSAASYQSFVKPTVVSVPLFFSESDLEWQDSVAVISDSSGVVQGMVDDKFPSNLTGDNYGLLFEDQSTLTELPLTQKQSASNLTEPDQVADRSTVNSNADDNTTEGEIVPPFNVTRSIVGTIILFGCLAFGGLALFIVSNARSEKRDSGTCGYSKPSGSYADLVHVRKTAQTAKNSTIPAPHTCNLNDLIATLGSFKRKWRFRPVLIDELYSILTVIGERQPGLLNNNLPQKYIWQFNNYVETTNRLLNTLIDLHLTNDDCLGKNAINTKQEILDALPSILDYFKSVLNDLYQDQYIDVSCDVSVLKSISPGIQPGLIGKKG